jgi:hypothetical protein
MMTKIVDIAGMMVCVGIDADVVPSHKMKITLQKILPYWIHQQIPKLFFANIPEPNFYIHQGISLIYFQNN